MPGAVGQVAGQQRPAAWFRPLSWLLLRRVGCLHRQIGNRDLKPFLVRSRAFRKKS